MFEVATVTLKNNVVEVNLLGEYEFVPFEFFTNERRNLVNFACKGVADEYVIKLATDLFFRSIDKLSEGTRLEYDLIEETV